MSSLEIDTFIKDSAITFDNMVMAGFPYTRSSDNFYNTHGFCVDFNIPVYRDIIKVRFYGDPPTTNLVWLVAGENIIGLNQVKTMRQLAYLYKLLNGTL